MREKYRSGGARVSEREKKKGQDNSVYMQLLGPVFFYYFFYESNLPFLAVVSVLFLDAL